VSRRWRRRKRRRRSNSIRKTQQKIIDTFNRADPGTPDNYLLWLKAVAFAVVCATIAIMLVVLLFVLVSAQWRRARSAHPLRS
jgi:hypothetical protein